MESESQAESGGRTARSAACINKRRVSARLAKHAPNADSAPTGSRKTRRMVAAGPRDRETAKLATGPEIFIYKKLPCSYAILSLDVGQ